jgi:hypothetical protein
MNEIEHIWQSGAALDAIDPEPEFDTERVIWDAGYRREVVAALRQWRLRQDRHRTAIAPTKKAA